MQIYKTLIFFILTSCTGHLTPQYKRVLPNKTFTVFNKEIAVGNLIKDPNKWKKSLHTIKDKYSFNEKILIVSELGGMFSNLYNEDRANQVGTNADGVISIEELLESVKTGQAGGVCRDIASAQAIMLSEMGIESAYVVSFDVFKGRHANIIVQNPEDPLDILKINYGFAHISGGESGSSLLNQEGGLSDFGLEFKIYNRVGTPLLSLPSELGTILREVTDGEETTQVFSKQTTRDDNVKGIAFHQRWESQSDILNIELGMTYFKREGIRFPYNIKQEGIYVRGLGELNSPYLNINNMIKLRIETSGETAFSLTENSVSKIHSSDDSKNGEEVSTGEVAKQASLFVGVSGLHKNKAYQIQGSIKTQLVPAFSNEVSAEKIILTANKIEASLNIKKFLSNDLTISMEPKLIFRDFINEVGIGNAYEISSELVHIPSQISAYLKFWSPIQDHQARFLEGSTSKLQIGFEALNNEILYNISYEEDFDVGYHVVLFGSGLQF